MPPLFFIFSYSMMSLYMIMILTLSAVYLAVSSATLSQAFCQEGLGLSRLSSHLSRPMSCCCHCQLESGLCCQHHGFSSIATNLASWSGMLSLVISCMLLKGINHQFTPSAIIIRKTFMLFICETSEGQSYLVELDEHQATMKHVYHGLWKHYVGFVPFDTMKNQFLATGDAVKIIFSDMDNGYLLTTTAAEGGLPAVDTSRVAPATIAKGAIISTLIWCFLFNCWNKHLILVKVHRNTKAFDFRRIFLSKFSEEYFRS